jgi:hypothetical protein
VPQTSKKKEKSAASEDLQSRFDESGLPLVKFLGREGIQSAEPVTNTSKAGLLVRKPLIAPKPPSSSSGRCPYSAAVQASFYHLQKLPR